MTTSAIVISGIITVILILAIILIIHFRSRNIKQENYYYETDNIISELSQDVSNITPGKKIWLQTLEKNGFLSPLCSRGFGIIIGSNEMGTSEILKWIVNKINFDFHETHRISLYFDVDKVINIDKQIFAEDIYRSIVLAMVDPFLSPIHANSEKNNLRRKNYRIHKLFIKDNLDNNFIDMPIAEIAKNLNYFYDRFSISGVKLCLNNITNLHSEQLPYLIHLIIRTFEKSGIFDLVISGNLGQLTLMADTPQGPIGAQFGHDLFLGLNLEELLMPKSDQMIVGEQKDDIRYKLISDFLKLDPKFNKLDIREFPKRFFNPPDTWIKLFHFLNGEIDKICSSASFIIHWSKEKKIKVNPTRLSSLINKMPAEIKD